MEKARGSTQKQIELLAQQAASFDAAAHAKIEQQNDPYIIRRFINNRLYKQVQEENNNRQDILAVQNSFQQFESHVLRTLQGSLEQYFQVMNSQINRQSAMNADTLGNFQRIPADYEWVNFAVRSSHILVDPDAPPRTLSNITFPNDEHRSTKPLIDGYMERKSRNLVKGYNTGYFVISPALYLHEYKDTDDFRHEPSPELSFYLPDCIVGSQEGVKFGFRGKDVSSNKVGNAFHTNMDMNFKARSTTDAEKWFAIIKDAHLGSAHGHTKAGTAAAPVPVTNNEQTEGKTTTAVDGGESPNGVHPPSYEKSEEASAVNTNGQTTGTTATAGESSANGKAAEASGSGSGSGSGNGKEKK